MAHPHGRWPRMHGCSLLMLSALSCLTVLSTIVFALWLSKKAFPAFDFSTALSRAISNRDSASFPQSQAQAPELDLLWMAPFASGGGYSSESISYTVALTNIDKQRRIRIQQHGDASNPNFWHGLDSDTQSTLERMMWQGIALPKAIVVCHSEPGAWFPPLFQTPPCPPHGYGKGRSAYVIGRTMFETDRVSEGHVQRCNKMDEIWVPTDFHVESFAKSGVKREKLVKMPQSVDVHFFDPSKAESIPLKWGQRLTGPAAGEEIQQIRKNLFVFLSIFKWEYRKGWDVLVEAFFREFSSADGVVLYVLTNPYHGERNFGDAVLERVEMLAMDKPSHSFPRMHILDEHVPQTMLPSLYKSSHAFVLPSRGEGWGRPIVEAMAMSLPVIATNWSGMTEFMTSENSYPLPIDGLQLVEEGPFKGHFWAKPSVTSLQKLMRSLVESPVEGKAKGRKAREDMVEKYNPAHIAGLVLKRLSEVDEIVLSRYDVGEL